MSELLIGEIRMSYVNVFAPYAANGGEPKYSVTLLIPKSNTQLVQQIQVAIEQAKQEGVAKKFGGTMPGFVASPMHDGDGTKQTGEPYGEECKGHYVSQSSGPPASSQALTVTLQWIRVKSTPAAMATCLSTSPPTTPAGKKVSAATCSMSGKHETAKPSQAQEPALKTLLQG